MCHCNGIVTLTNLVRSLWCQTLLVNHFLADILPRHLVQLVHSRRDWAYQVVWDAADLENTIENFARIELDGVFSFPAEAFKNLIDDSDLVMLLDLTHLQKL